MPGRGYLLYIAWLFVHSLTFSLSIIIINFQRVICIEMELFEELFMQDNMCSKCFLQ